MDMFQGTRLFETAAGPDSRQHIAHMVSLLGLPPADFLRRSETGEPWKYFDTRGEYLMPARQYFGTLTGSLSNVSGHWTGTTTLSNDSLELLEHRLEGEKKAQFLGFVRKMLKWIPEERYTAYELLDDPWLSSS